MGTLQDAMKTSGLATEEQITSAQREKAEKERLDKARREAAEVERRERQLEASMPQFIKDAIKEQRDQVELYVTRAEKRLGQLPRRLRTKLLKLDPFDAFMLLGTALTLHGVRMGIWEGGSLEEHDKHFKAARQMALDSLYNEFRKRNL